MMQRILFLGMQGAFSLGPLQALIKAMPDIGEVVGVIVANPGGGGNVEELVWSPPAGSLPLSQPSNVKSTIIQLAWQHKIPAFHVGQLDAASHLLEQLNPNVICVACFSQKIPLNWIAYPSRGCFNVHPSRLPAYRGPTPLFWQLYDNEPHIGVTIHHVEAQLDAGDIVSQRIVELDPRWQTTEIEAAIGASGGELLVEALRGEVSNATPQNEAAATVQSYPTSAAKWLKPTWTIGHAMRFINGANEWGPMMLLIADTVLQIFTASDPISGRLLPQPIVTEAPGEFVVQFADGTLTLHAIVLSEQKRSD